MRHADDLRTPVVTVQQAIMERNLARMAERAASRGLALCPHIKTHKSTALARRQMELGTAGIMVAKLGEAAVMLDAGLTDQFIGYPLVGLQQETRLRALISQGLRPRVAVDSEAGIHLLARVGEQSGVTIPALIEIDTGFHRCGLEGVTAIRQLAGLIRATGVPLQGITCFGGHIGHRTDPAEITRLVAAENAMLAEIQDALSADGYADLIVSQGGTVPAAYLDQISTATEIRPGTYIYNDAAIVAAHAATWEDCAAQVITEVVSTPAADRAIIDAGAKTLAGDGPVSDSFGYVLERPDLKIERLSEEHGIIVRRDGGSTGLRIGDRLRIIPNHVCTMMNLHDHVIVLNGEQVVSRLTLEARGKVR